ncbi:MAG: cytochrome b/b6 domain-containing protein, partial [Parvularculaceae bacterium]|nr:cytochrome b/b6 domain-containing protein [Parvularculaceae bacterium]
HMDWHRASGLFIVFLLFFRLQWGLFGGETARFGRFVKGPGGVFSYLKGEAPATPGHNPLGGWSVVAMLAALLLQATAGLFAVDIDGIESGPLSHFVSFDQGRLAADIHGAVFNALLALVGLHLAAILFYAVMRRKNLVGPMITGADKGASRSADFVGTWRIAAAALAAGGATYVIANGFTF